MSVNEVAEERIHAESPADHNNDVTKAIRDYCSFAHPQEFALMLVGSWGSGKTHFMKTIFPGLGTTGTDPEVPLYVTLYGVKNAEEIGDQLFRQIHPILSHGATRFVGGLFSQIAKASIKVDLGHAVTASGVVPSVDLSAMLKGTKGRAIVFDDFERAEMSPLAILGYINPLVEHDNCKVVILADESRIPDGDDYGGRKEKTIGRTLAYRADAQSAYSAFLKQIDDEGARRSLTDHRDLLLRIFAESKLENLRLLKQSMWDYERFWRALAPEHRTHTDAIQELLPLFCAAAIELRAGKLDPKNFRRADVSLRMALGRKAPDAASEALKAIFSKYPTVRFESTLVEPRTIVDVVLRSRVQAEDIQRQLRAHPYFAKPGELPSWRALWLSSDSPSDEHEGIVARFEHDFAARTFRAQAEITHVIGLGLWLSKLGFPGWEESVVTDKIRAYVDDVYATGEAGPDVVGIRRLGDWSGGAYGLGFFETDDPRFRDLSRHHAARREEWRKRSYPAIARSLLACAGTDTDAFLRDVCQTNAGKSRYASLGVLHHIPVAEFVDTLMGSSGADRREILLALKIRYEHAASEPELMAELPWLNEVRTELSARAAALPPIARESLTNLVRYSFDPRLSPAELQPDHEEVDDQVADGAVEG